MREIYASIISSFVSSAKKIAGNLFFVFAFLLLTSHFLLLTSAFGQAPQNPGPGVNTAGDETFPYISPNNILYFSSNGHAGFGGLDIFASVQSREERDPSSGLSNKTDDGAQNIKVFLLTDKGTILQTTSTDGSGFFHFKNLNSDQNYAVRVDEPDPSRINQKKFYLTDARNKVVRVVVKGKDGIFTFETLPPDLSKLSALAEADVSLKNFSIAGNLYTGNQRAPLENTKVNLVNDKGEIVQSTTTNAFGSFVFMNISPDQNFTVTLDDSDPKLASKKIYFTNKSGKEISTGKGGTFRFQILASDSNTLSMLKVEDSDLLIDLKGTLYGDKEGKKRLPNANISLVDDKGNVAGTAQTDASGNFKFANLSADKNYMVRLNEEDPSLASKDVFLADAKGKIIAPLKSAGGKFFNYDFLPMEEQSLASIYFDDTGLQAGKTKTNANQEGAMSIIENVYYDYQKWDLLPQTVITLNKVVRAMKANKNVIIEVLANTDARGSDAYNMKLSQRRARAVVNYIISKGINKNRLTAIGNGETKPLNRCSEGVACTEGEYARNRRTEFNIKTKAK